MRTVGVLTPTQKLKLETVRAIDLPGGGTRCVCGPHATARMRLEECEWGLCEMAQNVSEMAQNGSHRVKIAQTRSKWPKIGQNRSK